MRKEERHQIKRDDLATILGSATDYVETHLRIVIVMGAALAVVAAAAVGAGSWWQGREARSARQLGELIRTYNAPITATIEDLQSAEPGRSAFTSIEERDRKVIDLAEEILKGGGPGGMAA